MTLDISNPGAEPLQVNGVTSDEGSFRPLSDSFTVDPGQSQGVEVQFAPVAMSGVSGTLTISHSASGGELQVSLRGEGVLASLTTVEAIAFGDVPAGMSVTRDLELANDGNGPLVVTWISLSAPEFAVDAKYFTVPASTSRTISVTYTASAPGEQTAVLKIIHNATGGETNIALRGRSIGAALTVSESTIDFGSVAIGGNATRSLEVTNTGTAACRVTQITVTDPAFSVNDEPFDLQPEESLTLFVTFRPEVLEDLSASLVLEANCRYTEQISTTLMGSGVAATPPLASGDGADSPAPTDPADQDSGQSDGGQQEDDGASEDDPTADEPIVPSGQVSLMPAWDTDGLAKPATVLMARPDQSITFQMIGSDLPAGSGIWLTVAYDGDLLAFEEERTDPMSLPGATTILAQVDGRLIIGITTSADQDALPEGILGEVTFRVSDTFTDTARVALESATITLPSGGGRLIDVGLGFEIVKDPTLVQLEEVIGDFNEDGTVDLVDFVAFKDAFGSTKTQCDLNGNGSVGFDDYLILASYIAGTEDS